MILSWYIFFEGFFRSLILKLKSKSWFFKAMINFLLNILKNILHGSKYNFYKKKYFLSFYIQLFLSCKLRKCNWFRDLHQEHMKQKVKKPRQEGDEARDTKFGCARDQQFTGSRGALWLEVGPAVRIFFIKKRTLGMWEIINGGSDWVGRKWMSLGTAHLM